MLKKSLVLGNFLPSTCFHSCLACGPPLFTLHLSSGHSPIPSTLVISHAESWIILVSPAFQQAISSGSQLIPNVSAKSIHNQDIFFLYKELWPLLSVLPSWVHIPRASFQITWLETRESPPFFGINFLLFSLFQMSRLILFKKIFLMFYSALRQKFSGGNFESYIVVRFNASEYKWVRIEHALFQKALPHCCIKLWSFFPSPVTQSYTFYSIFLWQGST